MFGVNSWQLLKEPWEVHLSDDLGWSTGVNGRGFNSERDETMIGIQLEPDTHAPYLQCDNQVTDIL